LGRPVEDGLSVLGTLGSCENAQDDDGGLITFLGQNSRREQEASGRIMLRKQLVQLEKSDTDECD